MRLTLCRKRAFVLPLLVTFIFILPTLTLLLGLYQSPYYVGYIWLRHKWLSAEAGARFDASVYEQILDENDDRILDAQIFLSKLRERNPDVFKKQRLSLEASRKSSSDGGYSGKEKESDNKILHVLIILISSGREILFQDGQGYDPYFLSQNVARFAKILLERSSESSTKYSFAICSVGDNMTAEEYDLKDLATIYRKLQAVTIFGPHHDVLAWPFEKEKLDYIFCLESGLKNNYEYLLVVEDDAMPRLESLAVIDNFLIQRRNLRNSVLDTKSKINAKDSKTSKVRELQVMTSSQTNGILDFSNSSSVSSDSEHKDRICDYDFVKHTGGEFYAKLYHPKRLQGYISLETERLLQLLAVSLLLGSVVHGCRLKIRSEQIRGPLDWIYCSVVVCMLCLMIGRPHLDSWRRLVSPYAHSVVPDVHCCTQAMLYTSSAALDVISYMKQIQCSEAFHKDDALWSYTVETRRRGEALLSQNCPVGEPVRTVKGFLIQPNLFEHIGFWSSIRKDFIDPHIMLE